jgi:hypothetical protein
MGFTSCYKNITPTAKKMLIITTVLYFTCLVAGFFFINMDTKYTEFSVGLFIGFLCTSIKIKMLDSSICKIANLEPIEAQNYQKLQYLARYFVTAISIGISIYFSFKYDKSYYPFFGTTLGLSFMPLVGYIVSIVIKKSI